MTRDLGDLIRTTGDDAAHSTARAFTPDAATSLFRAAHHRRVLRQAGAGTAAACVAAVIGVVALHPWGTTPPATTPSPTATSAPTATTPTTTGPSTTPTTSPTAAASTKPVIIGTVTHNPLLPDAKPLEAGLLENAGPGWALVEYVEYSTAVQSDGPAKPLSDVLYLVDPHGIHYEVRNLGPDSTLSIVDWQPGSSRVLATFDDPSRVEIVDLVTGKTVSSFSPPGLVTWSPRLTRPTGKNIVAEVTESGTKRLQRFSPSGELLSTLVELPDPNTSPSWIYSEDGTYVVLGVAYTDQRAGTYGTYGIKKISYDGATTTALDTGSDASGCEAVRWWDAERVLVRCITPGAPTTEYPTGGAAENMLLVRVDGGAPEALTTYAGDPEGMLQGAWDVWRFGDTQFDMSVGDDCGSASLSQVDPDGSSHVVADSLAGVVRVGDRLLIGQGCTWNKFGSFDPDTGTLTPYIASTDSIEVQVAEILAR
jgi:hypothetical protein